MSALLIWRHRENIRKLMNGSESKLGERKKPAPAQAGSAEGDSQPGA
jgi:glycerol-3-phosphate acyltransferase PlsY